MSKNFFKLLAGFFLLVSVVPSYGIIPQNLRLSGQGDVHYLGFIKVYDAALFVPVMIEQNRLLDEKTSRCLKLDYAVPLSVDKISLAAKTVIKRQHGELVFKRIQQQYKQLHDSYRDVAKGDSYTLCYDAPSRVTSLYLNERLLVRLPRSSHFANIYMGMWLGRISGTFALWSALRTVVIAVATSVLILLVTH